MLPSASENHGRLQICHEVADAWRRIKLDESVSAIVLRAAGERAFSAGLGIEESYGQPGDIWNHEDPGELLLAAARPEVRIR